MRKPADAAGMARSPLEAAVMDWASGTLAPNLVVSRVFISATDFADVERAFSRAAACADVTSRERARMRQALALAREKRAQFTAAKAVLALVRHDAPAAPGEALAACAIAFEQAARLAPLSASALYTLGDARLMQEATDEILRLMRRWDLLGRARRVLDIGCGAGRYLAPIAAESALVVGTDISPAMLDAARRRCSRMPNVHLVRAPGRDLAFLAPQAFDLVLAVDSFPYLVQAGVAQAHLRDIGRVLAPRGRCLILNYAYRDARSERRDLRALTKSCGLEIVREESQPFTHWDGRAFLLARAGATAGHDDGTRDRARS